MAPPKAAGPCLSSSLFSLFLLFTALAPGGCSKPEPIMSDAELSQKILGRWQFDTDKVSGELRFQRGGRMIMDARAKSFVLRQYSGEIAHGWKIKDGCLAVEVRDPGNDLTTMIQWPGSQHPDPIRIAQLDDRQMVLEEVCTFTRVD